MKQKERQAGVGRREMLRRLMAGAGAAAAIPAFELSAQAAAAQETAPPEPPVLGAALPPDPALSSPNWKPVFFDHHQNETLVVVSDLLIPETDTPGAKAAHVNRFIDLLLSAEPAETKKNYLEAIAWLDGYCLSKYSRPFTRLAPSEQSAVMALLTHDNGDPEIGRGVELFALIKDSISQAYYSSEIGMIEELKYQTDPFQASFPGCKNS